MADKARLATLRKTIERQEDALKAKRTRIKKTNAMFKAQKKKSIRDKMNHDIQIHSMENDLFTAKQAWYRLKLQYAQAKK